MTLLVASLLATLTVATVGTTSAPASIVPGFAEQTVLTALAGPTDMAFAPDGRVFVSEKSGIVKVFPSITTNTPTVVTDLRTQVFNSGDRGLLSLALDPQFPTRPYLYLLYTFDAPIGGTAPTWGTAGVSGDNCPDPPGLNTDGCVVSGRLSRITIGGNTMVGSEQVLINGWCQQFGSHSIGSVRFGPDGALYVSGGEGASYTFADYGQKGQPLNPCGDPGAPVGGAQTIPSSEGGSMRAQDLRTSGDPTGLSGSVLRLDPDTGNPMPDNPLASVGPDDNARRIIATGMRNPFRMTFEPGTNNLYVGDVGLTHWEEINRIPIPTGPVKNFGWPCIEGPVHLGTFQDATLCQNLYAEAGSTTSAVYQYPHGQAINANDTCVFTGGSATSGLAFSTGSAYPASYQNALFMADYGRKCIWVAFRGTNGQLDWSTVRSFNDSAAVPVSLQTGPDGLLYYVAISGSIRRFTYSQQAPTAVVSASATTGTAPLAVHFDGTQSTDAETPTQLSYSWDLNGDGIFGDATTPTADFVFAANGSYTVSLRVTDPSNLTNTASVPIVVGNAAPTAVIDTPILNSTYRTGDQITFHGSGTDPEDGTLAATRLSWKAVINHCATVGNCHQHPLGEWSGVAGASFSAPDHDYPSSIDISLTALDSLGEATTVVRHLEPKTTTLIVDSNPSGLASDINTDVTNGRIVKTVVQGSTTSIGAPSPQSVNGGTATFTSWSDGGGRYHDVVVPGANPLTVVASYTNTNIPTVSVPDVSAVEGNGGNSSVAFPITLSRAATQPITVTYQTAVGTAGPTDFWGTLPTTVTFNPGQTSKVVFVGIKPDAVVEPDETFSVQLSAPTNAVLGRSVATGTILNDDTGPIPRITVDDASVVEGNSGTRSVPIKVRLSSPAAAPVSVSLSTTPGTASATDFWGNSQTVTIPAGQTLVTTFIGIRPDTVYEADETFTINLANPVGATLANTSATVTIVNDDLAPQINIGDAAITEGNSGVVSAVVPVTLAAPSPLPVTFTWTVATGTATGADIWLPAGPISVTIPAGATTANLLVGIKPDVLAEGNEQFTVTLGNVVGASLGRLTADVTIIDDDVLPTVSVADSSALEGNAPPSTVKFTFTLSSVSALPVSFTWQTQTGTATGADFWQVAPTTATIAAGKLSVVVYVGIRPNAVKQPNRQFVVVLSNPQNATSGRWAALGTIIDDD